MTKTTATLTETDLDGYAWGDNRVSARCADCQGVQDRCGIIGDDKHYARVCRNCAAITRVARRVSAKRRAMLASRPQRAALIASLIAEADSKDNA